MRRANVSHRRGMTLAELVVSAGATAVLLTGIASALVLVSRALPEQGTPLNAYVAATDVVEQMTTELLCARDILTDGATTIEFTVADRDDDASDETILYEWSGNTGDPLIRKYNGANAVMVIEDVQDFQLVYDHVEVVDPDGTATSETGELELRSYDSSSSLSDLKVEKDRYWGQSFIPTLPDGSVEWSITEVWFKAKRDGPTDGIVQVVLYRTDASLRPTGGPLGQYSLPENALSDSYQWYGFSFDIDGLKPDEAVCIVLEHAGSGSAARVRYRGGGVTMLNAALLEYDNGWKARYDDKAMLFAVYGRALVADAGAEATTQGIGGVRIRLLAGEGATHPVTTSVHLLNTPEGG